MCKGNSRRVLTQFYKTKMCPFILAKGKCGKAQRCVYAHSEEELRPLPELSKTKMCPLAKKGEVCPEQDTTCPYAHHASELRHTDDLFKTSLCNMWKRGKCTAGENCRYAHGHEDLRARPFPIRRRGGEEGEGCVEEGEESQIDESEMGDAHTHTHTHHHDQQDRDGDAGASGGSGGGASTSGGGSDVSSTHTHTTQTHTSTTQGGVYGGYSQLAYMQLFGLAPMEEEDTHTHTPLPPAPPAETAHAPMSPVSRVSFDSGVSTAVSFLNTMSPRSGDTETPSLPRANSTGSTGSSPHTPPNPPRNAIDFCAHAHACAFPPMYPGGSIEFVALPGGGLGYRRVDGGVDVCVYPPTHTKTWHQTLMEARVSPAELMAACPTHYDD